MRRVGFLGETWNEYTRVLSNAIPQRFHKYLFTRKAAYIALGIISIEVVIAVSAYFLWFRHS